MHFVSDVIAGAILGGALGYGFAGLAARLTGMAL
jgi:membrane-associated phospholipid phosphatase